MLIDDYLEKNLNPTLLSMLDEEILPEDYDSDDDWDWEEWHGDNLYPNVDDEDEDEEWVW